VTQTYARERAVPQPLTTLFYTELCLNEKLLKQSNSQVDERPSLVKIEHF